MRAYFSMFSLHPEQSGIVRISVKFPFSNSSINDIKRFVGFTHTLHDRVITVLCLETMIIKRVTSRVINDQCHIILTIYYPY